MDQVSIWVLRDNKPIKCLNCWSSLNNNYYSSHFVIDIENKSSIRYIPEKYLNKILIIPYNNLTTHN